MHEAFYVATAGRPGPVVIDLPKDVQFATGAYSRPTRQPAQDLPPAGQGRRRQDRRRPRADGGRQAADLLHRRRRHQLRPRGLRAAARAGRATTGFPITSTLMGLGAFPASDPQWLGMLGMHGTYEANLAMHDCDVMIAIGARFDDRVTGRLDAFSPGSKKIHIDIDPSSINKNVQVDVAIVGDGAPRAGGHDAAAGSPEHLSADKAALNELVGADRRCGARATASATSPDRHAHQAAVRDRAAVRADQGPRRLHHHRGRPAPDVGGAVLPLRGAQPLDDLRRPRHHGLWPAGGDGRADRASRRAGHRHRRRGLDPDEHAGDVDGRRSTTCRSRSSSSTTSTWAWCASGRSCCTAARYSQSYSESLPDFVKLAEAFGAVGMRAETPDELDDVIREMIDCQRGRCIVRLPSSTKDENCFPMIPSGEAHNEMILGRRRQGDSGRSSTTRARCWSDP